MTLQAETRARMAGWLGPESLRRAVAVVALLLVAGMAWAGFGVFEAIGRLRQNQMANLAWSATQFEAQLVKLQHLLAEAKAGNPNRHDLQRRWDNLQSWVEPLEAAMTADLLRDEPNFAPTFAQVKATVEDMQRMVAVRAGSPIWAAELIEAPLASIAVPVRRLAVMGGQYWDRYTERNRGLLVDRIAALAGLAMALGALVLANQLLLMRQRARLRDLAGELSGALQAADLAGRAKSDFLARMSHELRTPLNAIIGFAETMQGELFGPIANARYRDYVGFILQSGRHLLGLVNTVLDVARIESGKLETDSEPVRVQEVAAQCLDMLRAQADQNRVALSSDIPGELPPCVVDRQHLRQILLNLLTNAIKFTPPGGRVTLGAARGASGALEVWVRDTGVGIAPADLPTILEPFSQVRDHRVYRGEGVGLGLPIAKSLAELNGGVLEIVSDPGKGTEARIRFAKAA